MINKNKNQGLNLQDCSYLTFNVVDWIDVFIRPTYKQIIVDALNYCVETKEVHDIFLGLNDQSYAFTGAGPGRFGAGDDRKGIQKIYYY